MKIFRSKRPELSRGHWREKVSDLFGQTAHFSPVGSGRKKFPKKRTTSPVSVKWVLNEEIFKIFRSKPAKPSSGYWEKSHQAIHSMGLTAQVFLVNGDGR